MRLITDYNTHVTTHSSKAPRKRKPPPGGKCVESLNGPERGTKLITLDKSMQPYQLKPLIIQAISCPTGYGQS